jgi:hypothetical protein
VEFIAQRGGEITPRQLQRANGHRYPTALAAAGALDALVSAGKGKWEERRPPHGGHSERVLILCPTVRRSTPPG